MTKKDIISLLAERTSLTTSQAMHAVEAVIDILADAIVSGEPVTLRGFGCLRTVKRARKLARNIRRGSTVMIPERMKAKFVTYDELQQRINDAYHERTSIQSKP